MLSVIRSALPRKLKPQACFFCYHGVIHERRDARLQRNFHLLAEFQRQAQFLKRHLVGPAGAAPAAITFDDGYANNLLAAEILSDAKLPWTLFVSTGAVGREGIIWTVELSLLLLRGRAARIDVFGRTWQLDSRQEREAVFQAVRTRLKSMPATPRRMAMSEIRSQFPASETQRLLEEFPSFQMLTWKELRQLSEAGVEIGSHGVDHEIHHATQDGDVRRRELVESKLEIERQIGKPCRLFAFPNGNCCEHSAQEAQAAGYEMAFTTQPGAVKPDTNRFLAPRLSPGGSVAGLRQQWNEY